MYDELFHLCHNMEDPDGPGARFKDFYNDLNQVPDGLHALRQSYKAELYVANFFYKNIFLLWLDFDYRSKSQLLPVELHKKITKLKDTHIVFDKRWQGHLQAASSSVGGRKGKQKEVVQL